MEGIEDIAALKARCAEIRLVCVGDRESDLYEPFATERPEGVDWLVRVAAQPLRPASEPYLWETVLATAPLGDTELLVPARGNLAQRTTHLTLRCTKVRLRLQRARASHLPELDVFAIHALEEPPP